MPQFKTSALSLLACVPLLSACGTSVPRVETVTEFRVEKLRPPEPLLDCAPHPLPPNPDTARQADVARYLVDVAAAGEDCRAKVEAWAEWARQLGRSTMGVSP